MGKVCKKSPYKLLFEQHFCSYEIVCELFVACLATSATIQIGQMAVEKPLNYQLYLSRHTYKSKQFVCCVRLCVCVLEIDK